MSLLCPPVATAVKYCRAPTSLSAPNWGCSEFHYPVIITEFYQAIRLLLSQQFKGKRGSVQGRVPTVTQQNMDSTFKINV